MSTRSQPRIWRPRISIGLASVDATSASDSSGSARTSTPPWPLAAIAEEIGRKVDYRPVETDGAARAAKLLAELL